MTDIYKWRVFCTTTSTYQFVWAEDEPTTCPTDTSHTIDPSKSVIVEVREENTVKIKEENTPTGGNFRAETVAFDIPANSTVSQDFSWKCGINVLELNFYPRNEEVGNIIDIEFGPDTITGNITSDVAIGDTIINVSTTVIENVYVGYHLKLFDGVNTDDLGMVISVDKVNNTVTMDVAATKAFSAASPTYIQQTVYLTKQFEISNAWRYALGESKIGGNYIPANLTTRVRYQNNTINNVRFVATLEYLY